MPFDSTVLWQLIGIKELNWIWISDIAAQAMKFFWFLCSEGYEYRRGRRIGECLSHQMMYERGENLSFKNEKLSPVANSNVTQSRYKSNLPALSWETWIIDGLMLCNIQVRSWISVGFPGGLAALTLYTASSSHRTEAQEALSALLIHCIVTYRLDFLHVTIYYPFLLILEVFSTK